MMIIEPATQADLPALANLAARGPGRWSQDALAEELARERSWLLVARAQTMLGFCVGWRIEEASELLLVIVEAHARRRGVGRALLRALMDAARAQGCAWMDLEVARRNEAARALYESEGFALQGRRPRYYRDGDDALLLRSAL